MPTNRTENSVTVTFVKEKATKRFTKYNAPEPLTGAIYVPLVEGAPDALEVTIKGATNGK